MTIDALHLRDFVDEIRGIFDFLRDTKKRISFTNQILSFHVECFFYLIKSDFAYSIWKMVSRAHTHTHTLMHSIMVPKLLHEIET